MRGLRIALIFLLVAMLAPLAVAQTSRPATPTSLYEGQAIRRPHPADAQATAVSTSKSTTMTGLDLPRLAVAMGIVLAAILGVRWLILRTVPGMKTHGSSKSIRVLARTPIAPRQQVVLVQVGRRVIVVGDSQGQLTALAQIKDPDEIAALVGQTEADLLAPTTGTPFRGLFRKAQHDFDDAEASADAPETVQPSAAAGEDPTLQNASQEISGLIARMRSLTSQLGRG